MDVRKSERFSQIETLVLLTVGYVLAGKLGLQLAFDNPSATPVWAPTGIALAALLILGYRVWPAIFIGAFLVNFSTTHDVFSSIGIAIGNCLEGIVGAFLVSNFAGGRQALNKASNILKFTLFGAVVSPVISATIGVVSLAVFGFAHWADFGGVWLTWWIGDAVSVVTIASALLMLSDSSQKEYTRNQIIEIFVYLISLVGVSFAIFGRFIPALTNQPTSFVLIPFLVWPGTRFRQREAAVAVLIVSSIAVWGTLMGGGPFSPSHDTNSSLLLLQAYIAVIALTTYFLAALVAENRLAEAKLSQAYDTALEGWSKALDMRDKETEGHTQRVTEMTIKLATFLKVSAVDLVHIRRGALLHDIGKICIPDNILLKPGPLSDDEWQVMRMHPVYAYTLLYDTPQLREAIEIPYCHHEKWDGTGYPRGLIGEEIPFPARIFAVVDVWDALRSKRPYRVPMPDGEVISYMQSLSGSHFDPKVLQAFVQLLNEIPRSEVQINMVSAIINET